MGWLQMSGEFKVAKFLAASQFRESLYQPEVIRNLFRVNGELKYAMALYVKERKKPLSPIMLTQVFPPEANRVRPGVLLVIVLTLAVTVTAYVSLRKPAPPRLLSRAYGSR